MKAEILGEAEFWAQFQLLHWLWAKDYSQKLFFIPFSSKVSGFSISQERTEVGATKNKLGVSAYSQDFPDRQKNISL